MSRCRPGNVSTRLISHHPEESAMHRIVHVRKMAYTCRGCGTQVSYPGTFKKCPVCGIKWG